MPRKYPPGYIMPGISHVLDCHDQPIEVIPIADLQKSEQIHCIVRRLDEYGHHRQ